MAPGVKSVDFSTKTKIVLAQKSYKRPKSRILSVFFTKFESYVVRAQNTDPDSQGYCGQQEDHLKAKMVRPPIARITLIGRGSHVSSKCRLEANRVGV
jgi:hypothetical protein